MNAIEIKNVRKEYPEFVLGELSLSLPTGCVMGLVGENGAGKSTLIRLMLHMAKPTAGEISILGKDALSADFDSVKEEIGVVLDEGMFPPMVTAKKLNQIMKHVYRNWDEESYWGYLKEFSLPEKTPFSKYSRGMKMKLSIAAALSHKARLLILDEATGGLDPVVRDEILEILNDYTRNENHSVLLSSHIVSDLEKVCDYIAFLHQGKLLLCEEKDRLLEKYGLVRCTEEELSGLPEGAVAAKRTSPYGVEVMVERAMVPSTFSVSPVGIEEIFIYLIKGRRSR